MDSNYLQIWYFYKRDNESRKNLSGVYFLKYYFNFYIIFLKDLNFIKLMDKIDLLLYNFWFLFVSNIL